MAIEKVKWKDVGFAAISLWKAAAGGHSAKAVLEFLRFHGIPCRVAPGVSEWEDRYDVHVPPDRLRAAEELLKVGVSGFSVQRLDHVHDRMV